MSGQAFSENLFHLVSHQCHQLILNFLRVNVFMRVQKSALRQDLGYWTLLDQNDDSLECKALADFESTSMCARTAQREDSRPEAFELGYGYTCFGFAGHCQLDPL